MKHIDATEPLSIPSADGGIPELTAWIEALTIGTHAGLKLLTTASFAAKPPTLYIETTIVISLAGRISRDYRTARMQLVTRAWWASHRHKHNLYVSDAVYAEASKGDEDVIQERRRIMEPLAVLRPSDQTRELAGRILAECRLPEQEYNDAHHAALCAIHGIQVLLTWNCAHLANVNRIPHIGLACEAYGYAPPTILTPQQLIGACAYPQ